MFTMLIVMVSLICTCNLSNCTLYVQFIVCQLYLNDVVFPLKGYATQECSLFSQGF